MIIIIILVVLFLGKRKKLKELVILPKTAHNIAYEALRELKNKGYLKNGRVQEYYFELSSIMRQYVDARFSLPAPEMTTEEFLTALRDSNCLNAEQKNLMGDFLSGCDLVKFAQYIPDDKEIESTYEAARRFIDDTSTRSV